MFATKATLAAALGEFCDDEAAAEVTHGTIGLWDVSAVTDMKELIKGTPCTATFNADISSWDTSSVTTMMKMFEVRSARALAANSAAGSSHPGHCVRRRKG